MDLPILLPGEVETTPFRVTLRERFRDVAQRIKVEFELPSDRDALFLVADGVRASSKYMKGCPQGLLDPGNKPTLSLSLSSIVFCCVLQIEKKTQKSAVYECEMIVV